VRPLLREPRPQVHYKSQPDATAQRETQKSCILCLYILFFILWAAVSAGYSALLFSSYFERINDDDDDDDDFSLSGVGTHT